MAGRHNYQARNCVVGGFVGYWATADAECIPCRELDDSIQRLRRKLAEPKAPWWKFGFGRAGRV